MSALTGKELLQHLKKTTGINAFPLLQQLSHTALTRSAFIKQYHEQLLFLRAFPFNKTILNAANAETERIAAAAKKAGHTLYAGLCGDGLAHTEIICNYSLPQTVWLANKFTSAITLHEAAADAETVRKTLQLLCPYVEFEKTTQDDLNLKQRIRYITGFKNPTAQLRWLLTTFSNSNLPSTVKEELFRQLQVFVQWKITDPAYSRTFLHVDTGKFFFQKTFIKKVNTESIINQKINTPVKLSAIQQIALCDSIKTSLALLCRETDPVTYADEQAIQLFHMGRGFSIALLYMQKEKRLSLESYIGYMAFKNGVPVSYGGGWIFGNCCKIGVNIYPAFRKGESAWMFCQVLRLYRQYFNVECFSVSPYQFGKGNAEGLKSGAFWFYYRLGFRPVNHTINALALNEWEKINHDKVHRTPLQVLKKLSAFPVSLHFSKKMKPPYNATDISAAISNHINQNYNCNRKTAITAGFKKLHKQFGIRSTNETLALLCLLAEEKIQITENVKKKLAHLSRLKENGHEWDYVLYLQQLLPFFISHT